MLKIIVKIIAAIAIVALVLAPIAGIARADSAPAKLGCGDTYLAVGGYPSTTKVPAGYTPIYTPGGIFPWENGGYDHGQTVGAANLVEAVEAHAYRCPDSSVNLFGHSYGAAIVHTAVGHIDAQPYAPRVNVVLTGNPRHPGGVEDTWSWINLPGFTMRGAGIRPQNLGSWSDRCQPRDPICDMPGNVIGDIDHMVGYLFQGTHSYGGVR